MKYKDFEKLINDIRDKYATVFTNLAGVGKTESLPENICKECNSEMGEGMALINRFAVDEEGFPFLNIKSAELIKCRKCKNCGNSKT